MVANLKALPDFEHEAEQSQLQDTNSSCEPKPMLTWNHTEVLEWLKDNTDEKTAGLIGGQGYTGEQWVNVTVQDLEKIIPKRKVCERLIEDRDEFVDSESQTVEKFPQQGLHGGGTEQTEFVEPFGEFDRPVDIIESCRQYNKYPTSGSRPTDLIEPFRRFVPLKEVFTKGSNFDKFAAEVISFGAACLNECTNGVIYFGVEELKKVGVTVACGQLLLDKCLTQRIVKSFHESQVDKVLKCIRPIRWVPVVCENASEKRYIIEISVNPAHELCGDEVFLVNRSKDLYKFDETGRPSVISQSTYFDTFKEKVKLARRRKQKEDESVLRSKKPNSAHRDKLVGLLCRGKSKFRQSSCPILVLPPADSDLDSDYVEETFSFLSNIKWKAVLDFGDDRKFLDMINKQDRLFKIRDVAEFDTDLEDPSAVKSTKEDAYNGHVPNWIFMNGDVNTNCSPRNLQNWRTDLLDAFRACSKTYTKGNKVLIVFLLHSHINDVYVEACAHLCEQSENFVCIVQSDTIGKTWQAEITRRDYVDKMQVSKQMVSGLPWNYVGEIVKEITSDEPQTCCQVQTNEGEKVLTIKKELCDLNILGFNECENVKITDELLRQKEIEFYKGGKVDWLNVRYDGVCSRDIFPSLRGKVRSALKENAIEREITEGINRITLYHQPGSGGTTCARNVLWEFRKEFKCAEITHYTENTCAQIAKLRDFGEPPSEDPLPLLLLIDNLDPEKLAELLAKLRKQAQKRDRNESRSNVYCVCLTVESRSNLPKEVAEKSDPYECLRQNMSDREEKLFEKQSQILQAKKLACHTLVAFNIMKENFDKEFINKTVDELIKAISNDNELFLLKYLAFLNFYDVGQRDVQLREFTDLIDGVDIDWADDFSDALNVLVSQEIGANTHLCVKISHPLLSGEILKVLRQGPLSQFTKEFLANKYIHRAGTQPVVNLRRHLAAIVKQRAKDEEENRESFSPLILAIIKEDWVEAASVLEMVYRITDDVFVAQQLARLFIEYKSWESALKYASEAAEKLPDNYHLLDTKGQVYRCKLEAQYESAKNDSIDLSQALYILKEAKDGIAIFKNVQKLSHMKSLNPAMRPTISGQLGSLQVYASLLQNLALLPVFAPLAPRKIPEVLREFLDGGCVPQEIQSWSDPVNYIDFLQSIPSDVMETLRYIEDFHSHFVFTFYSDKEFGRERYAVRSLKNRLAKFISKRHKFSPGATPKQRKDNSWLLGAPNLNTILEQLKTMGPHEKQQEVTVSDESVSYLATLLGDAKECLKTDPKNYDNMEYFLSTTMIISCYFDQTNLYTQISYEEAQLWSHRLYTSRVSRAKRIEPYMYYVMLHWPKAGDHQGKKEVSDAVSAWGRIYSERYSDSLAMRAFLFAKGIGFKSFVHASQLSKKHRNFWKDERLRRFTGTLYEKGTAIYVQDDETRENILSIPTAFLISDSNLWRNRVTFVIAITYMGPKAYDVQRKC